MVYWVEVVGLVGGFTLSSMMVPQVLKVHRTKSAKDLSWIFLGQYFVGLTLLIIYAWSKNLWSIYIPMLFEITMCTSQMIMKYVYDKRSMRSNEEIPADTADKNPFQAQTEGTAEGNPMYGNV
jgi:MtN3 and saliva related transmembrane protein